MMRVEEQYYDVLQNIEFAIVSTYREHPDMTDYSVMRALEALIDAYGGEKIGRGPRDFRLSDLEQKLLDRMRGMCEWRLGRREIPVEDTPSASGPKPEPITVDEVILCLKRLLKSTQRWNKEGGMQGYLDFVEQYIK